MEKVLEVKGLTKLYRNKRGIRDISFDINKGEIFGFLGPNGAGKTTVMKTITGLCRGSSGAVKIMGYDIVSEFEKAMESVGCIIETADVYEYMTGYKNLEMSARFYDGINKSRINEVIDMVGLSKYKDDKAGNYSLGMKQRLGLAGAILSNPGFIIMDEPNNGIDIEGMVDIRNIVTSLSKENNTTFFISSHLVHEIETLCTKAAIICDGCLISEIEISKLEEMGFSSLEDFYIKNIKNQRGREDE